MQRTARDLRLDQLAAAPAGLLVPGGDRLALARAHQLRSLSETGDRGIDLGGDGLAIPGEDVAPDRRVGSRHPGGVPEARPDLRQVLGLLAERRRRLRDQDVGDHVRKMADRRHQAVMRLGLDRLRARPQVRDRALHAVVEHPARRGRRRQVPAGALEEVRSGVLHARGLRSGEGMPTDEATVRAEGGDQVPLHRADVGDRAILGRRVQRLRGEAGKRNHRGGAEDQLRPLDRLRDGLVRRVDCAELPGPLEQLPVGVESGHFGVEPGAGGESDRPTDQTHAEDGDLHCSGFAPLTDSRAQTVERQHRRVPVDAGVGDRLAVDQVAIRFEVLAARHQE